MEITQFEDTPVPQRLEVLGSNAGCDRFLFIGVFICFIFSSWIVFIILFNDYIFYLPERFPCYSYLMVGGCMVLHTSCLRTLQAAKSGGPLEEKNTLLANCEYFHLKFKLTEVNRSVYHGEKASIYHSKYIFLESNLKAVDKRSTEYR